MAEEDEDVIVEGSALYEHLHSMGYTDFETVGPPITADLKKTNMKTFVVKKYFGNIYKGVHSSYSWITQEENVSKSQIAVILQSEVLLNDHAFIIHNIMQKYTSTSLKVILQDLFVFGSVVAISSCILFLSHKNILTYMFVSSAICLINYLKYLRFCAQWDLENLISLQNQLYHLCKKGLQILRSTQNKKVEQSSIAHQLSGLTAKRIKHFQRVMEYLMKHMEDVSCCYYNFSMIISKLLPSEVSVEYQTTQFEDASIKLHGEVTYKSLKNLYHKYILMQSEMLLLLAVAYDKDTWDKDCKKVPEFLLAHLVNILLKVLEKHKQDLSQAIDNYYNSETDVVRYKYHGRSESKWQDVYIHLDLASCKIQMAYKEMELLLRDFDIYEKGTESNAAAEVMQKIHEVCKLLDTAKSFAEFSSLLIPKTKRDNSEFGKLIINDRISDNKPRIMMSAETEPYIVDEVFEEYIKEEYYKSLCEENSDVSTAGSRLDKLLAKNFMSELKEVLIEKHESMREREMKALRRMCKDPETDSLSKEQINEIPIPPPMPPLNDSPVLNAVHKKDANEYENISLRDEIMQSLNSNKRSPERKIPLEDSDMSDGETSEKLRNTSFDIRAAHRFALNLPAPSLKISEEVFADDGEDSEDEPTDNENANDS